MLKEENQMLKGDIQKVIRENKILKEEVQKIQKSKEELLAKNELLKNQNQKIIIEKLEKEKQKFLFDPLRFILERKVYNFEPYSLFYNHFNNVINNIPFDNGNRYNNYYIRNEKKESKDIFKMYAILSFCPPFWYNIIRQMFLLPDLTTCIRFRKEIQKKLHLEVPFIDNTNLGEIPEFNHYLNSFWSIKENSLNDNRVVLAIDAAALKANCGFNSRTGETRGLINDMKLTEAQIEEYSRDFNSFVINNNNIAKDAFIILLCPLDPNLKPIVLSTTFTGSGSASDKEKQLLERYKEKLKHLHFNVIGCASDGDPQYLSYATKFAEKICGEFWMKENELLQIVDNYLQKPLWQLNQSTNSENWFPDVLHLLKTHRYFLLESIIIKIICIPNSKILSLPLREYLKDIPNSAFDNSSMSKMDDRLVFQFFNWEIIKKAIEENSFLGPILLPSAILLQVFFNQKLTKNERYDLLNFGAAIIYVQLMLYKNDLIGNFFKHCSPPYKEQYMIKYLLLASSLASVFSEEKPFNLANCSTHPLEHFFGTVRRLSERDDSKENFRSCVKKSICLEYLGSVLNVINRISGRVHEDKAAIVEEGPLDENLKESPFIQYIYLAINFIEESYGETFHTRSYLYNLIKDPNNFENISEISERGINLEIPVETPKRKCTANSIGFINLKGWLNFSRYKSDQQSKILVKTSVHNNASNMEGEAKK